MFAGGWRGAGGRGRGERTCRGGKGGGVRGERGREGPEGRGEGLQRGGREKRRELQFPVHFMRLGRLHMLSLMRSLAREEAAACGCSLVGVLVSHRQGLIPGLRGKGERWVTRHHSSGAV